MSSPRSEPRCLTRLASLATPERVRRYPVTLTVVFLVVWLGGFVAERQGRVLDAWGKFIGNDFVAFYTGGRFVLDGRMHELYDLSAQHAFQQALTPVELAQTSPFINPPFATLWYAPWAAIGDYLWALVAWWAVGFACIAGSVWWVRRATPHLLERPAWHLWAIVMCAPPTLLWLGYGQATALILLVWSVVYGLMASARPVSGAMVLGMLAIKPQLALGWVLILAMQRRLGALCAGAGVLAAWIVVSLWWWPEATRTWWAMRGELVEMLRAPSYPAWGVCSLHGFFNGLVYPFSAPLADALSLMASVGVGAGLVWLWWGARAQESFHGRVAITMMCAPLLAVQYYTYDLMLGVLPVWIVVGLCHDRFKGVYLDGGAVLVWTTWLALAALVVPPLLAAQSAWLTSRGMTPWFVQPMPWLILGWSRAVYRVLVSPSSDPAQSDSSVRVVIRDEGH